jgi:hypothetical protein
MWCRILYVTGSRAVLIPDSLTFYRQRSTSLSHSFNRYLSSVDQAMYKLRQMMPDVPEHIFRAGHAEHYRIAAMKSLTVGKRREAGKRLLQTFRLSPRHFVTSWRTMGTALGIVIPTGFRLRINRMLHKISLNGVKILLLVLLAFSIVLLVGHGIGKARTDEKAMFSAESAWNLPIPLTAAYAVMEPRLNTVYAELSTWQNPDDYSLPVYSATSLDPHQPILYNEFAWAKVFDGSWKRFGNTSDVEAEIIATSKPVFPNAGNWHSTTSSISWVLPPYFNKLINPPDPPLRVRLPVIALPAAGTDGYIVVFQDNDSAFEAINSIRLSTGELVAFQYQITSTQGDGSGYANGTAASMIPVYAGLIRENELATGVVNHAMKIFAAPNLLKPLAVYPALAFDRGAMTENPPYSGNLPMGARIAIPHDVDLASLGLQSPIGRSIARAAQRYGFIITDRGGGTGLSIGVEKGALHGGWNFELESDIKAIFKVVQIVKEDDEVNRSTPE